MFKHRKFITSFLGQIIGRPASWMLTGLKAIGFMIDWSIRGLVLVGAITVWKMWDQLGEAVADSKSAILFKLMKSVTDAGSGMMPDNIYHFLV